METVRALVKNNEGRFAVMETEKGDFRFPTCKFEVGISLIDPQPVKLDDSGLTVLPDVYLGVDKKTFFYAFNAYRGELYSPNVPVKAHWMTAAQILELDVKPEFSSVTKHLRMLARSPEKV